MASKINFVISATDQASGPIGKVRRALGELSGQAQSGKLSKLSDSLSMSLTSSGGALSAVSKFVSGSGLIAGAIAGLVIKLGQIESQWASSVRSMNNLGIRTGLPTTTAYGLQYAGRLAGLSPEEANGGIEQVRQTYSDAINNRNPEALKRYQAAGISTDPTRMESIESVLTKLAAYSETLRSQGKYGGAENFLNTAGAGQLTDFLNRGPGQVAADLKAAKSYIPDATDIQRARDYADASAKLSITYDRLKTTVLSGLEPALEGVLSSLQFGIDSLSGRPHPEAQPGQENSTEQRLWRGFEQFGNDLRGRGDRSFQTGLGGAPDQTEAARSMVEWYVNHGLSRSQAIGMAANAQRESMFDERAVGDNGKAVGLYQWHPDRQKGFQDRFERPLATSTREDQMAYSLVELQTTEAAAGKALLATNDAATAARRISGLYERPQDPAEGDRRAEIARQLDSQLGPATQDGGRMKIEIIHKNAPAGTNVNVSAPANVDTTLTTDRQQAPLGDQFAYSPGAF
ncbi:MAG: Phage-related tail protein [Bradyrhizobium sp.]|nr:Phage-related tail protein [Bradyrhizobium sp.]